MWIIKRKVLWLTTMTAQLRLTSYFSGCWCFKIGRCCLQFPPIITPLTFMLVFIKLNIVLTVCLTQLKYYVSIKRHTPFRCSSPACHQQNVVPKYFFNSAFKLDIPCLFTIPACGSHCMWRIICAWMWFLYTVILINWYSWCLITL